MHPHENGGVAQLVERILSMDEVLGSIPGASNNFVTFAAVFLMSSWRTIHDTE